MKGVAYHKMWCVMLFLVTWLLAGCTAEVTETEKKIPEGEQIEIHYIDVGQADATLIMSSGEAMLIDGGNVEDSSLIYAYLKEQQVEQLDYIIATHVHEDHVGGLAGALNYAEVETVYCPVKEYDAEHFQNFQKYVELQGKEIQVPEVGTSFELGYATCTILGVNTIRDDENNTSIVLKIEFGDQSFLFCGDVEEAAESLILASGQNINCDVLKVPHHGSDSSMSYAWLLGASPQYAVISAGKDNEYGHPHQDIIQRLEMTGVEIYRTDQQGHIICTSDGKHVEFEVREAVVYKDEGAYVLNLNSKKFHYPNCPSVEKMSEKNKQAVEWSRNEIVANGYEPCGNCKP